MRRIVDTLLRAGLACAIAVTSVGFAGGQATSPPGAGAAQGATQSDTQEVLKVLDQVVEQNRKLEEQNRELMTQVNILRQKLAASPGVPHPGPEQPVAPPAVAQSGTAARNLRSRDRGRHAPPSRGIRRVTGQVRRIQSRPGVHSGAV